MQCWLVLLVHAPCSSIGGTVLPCFRLAHAIVICGSSLLMYPSVSQLWTVSLTSPDHPTALPLICSIQPILVAFVAQWEAVINLGPHVNPQFHLASWYTLSRLCLPIPMALFFMFALLLAWHLCLWKSHLIFESRTFLKGKLKNLPLLQMPFYPCSVNSALCDHPRMPNSNQSSFLPTNSHSPNLSVPFIYDLVISVFY